LRKIHATVKYIRVHKYFFKKLNLIETLCNVTAPLLDCTVYTKKLGASAAVRTAAALSRL
jgi:hypothetical protein